MLLTLILIGSLSLAYWTILNAQYIRDGQANERWTSTFVLGSSKLVSGTYIICVWLALFAFGHVHIPTSSVFWWSLSITLCLNVLFEIFRYKSYGLTSIGLIAPFASVSPVLTILTAWLILGELPTWLGALGVIITAVSMYLLHTKNGWTLKNIFQPFRSVWDNLGTRYAFLSSIPPSVAIVFDKKAVAMADPITFSMFSVVGIGLSALIIEMIVRGKKRFLEQARVTDIKRLFKINIFYVIANLMFNFTFLFAIVSYVSALRRFVVVFEVILAYAILHERTDLKKKIIAAVGVATGAILISLSR